MTSRRADYDLWHTREHVPERVGITGFLAGRRYAAEREAFQRYLTLYDVEASEVYATPAYRSVVDQPTAWTQSMRPDFRNFSRLPCAKLAEAGRGMGGAVRAVRFRRPHNAPALTREGAGAVRAEIAAMGIVVACRLGLGDTEASFNTVAHARVPDPTGGDEAGALHLLVAEAPEVTDLDAVAARIDALVAARLSLGGPGTAQSYAFLYAVERTADMVPSETLERRAG